MNWNFMVYWAGMETGRDGEQRSRPVFKINESKKRKRKKDCWLLWF